MNGGYAVTTATKEQSHNKQQQPVNIASYIDHTLLKSTAARNDIEKLCTEAEKYHFAAVCVPPYYTQVAKALLPDNQVKVATVIGFPLGYSAITSKKEEIKQALDDGADELDVVICLAALKSGDWNYLEQEIKAVMHEVQGKDKIVKIIIESGMLSDEEIIRCCALYARYQVQFLKTSTGYAPRGATVEAVRLMKQQLPPEIRIKASGGIRTFEFANELIRAGASRLGCSAGIEIMEEASRQADKNKVYINRH
jgi:deoxyribose-phosphate aldolase